MNRHAKRFRGFTLVELIVVIAIIGVLAAILVPTILGYVNKAKFTSANSSAKNLYDAAMTAVREQDVVKPVLPGVYTYEENDGVNGMIYDETICHYIYQYFGGADGYDWAVTIRDDVAIATAIRKNTSDPYLGCYPKVNNSKQDGKTLVEALNYAENGTW